MGLGLYSIGLACTSSVWRVLYRFEPVLYRFGPVLYRCNLSVWGCTLSVWACSLLVWPVLYRFGLHSNGLACTLLVYSIGLACTLSVGPVLYRFGPVVYRCTLWV